MDHVRAIHAAALALGAECEQECPFYQGEPAAKSYTLDRARAFAFLHGLTN